jgi:hypothetical protein
MIFLSCKMLSHYRCNWVKCFFFVLQKWNENLKFMKNDKLQKIKIKTNIVIKLLLKIFQEIENSCKVCVSTFFSFLFFFFNYPFIQKEKSSCKWIIKKPKKKEKKGHKLSQPKPIHHHKIICKKD